MTHLFFYSKTQSVASSSALQEKSISHVDNKEKDHQTGLYRL